MRARLDAVSFRLNVAQLEQGLLQNHLLELSQFRGPIDRGCSCEYVFAMEMRSLQANESDVFPGKPLAKAVRHSAPAKAYDVDIAGHYDVRRNAHGRSIIRRDTAEDKHVFCQRFKALSVTSVELRSPNDRQSCARLFEL